VKSPVAIFADAHIHDHAPFAVDRDGYNSRLQYGCDTLMEIDVEARTRGCKSLICAGDLFHSRKRIGVDVHDLTCRVLQRCLPVHALAGNHDLSMDERTCWLTGLPLTAYRTATVAHIDGWRVGMVPWTDDESAVRTGLMPKADFYVGHFGVAGSKVGPNSFEIPGHITLDATAQRGTKNAWLFLGHYHKPQNLNTNTMYVGSPMHIDLSDAGDIKRFVVLHPDGKVESVPLTRAPRFIRVTAAQIESSKFKARDIDYIDIEASSADESKRARKIVERDGFTNVKSSVNREDTYVPRMDMRAVAQADVVKEYVKVAGVPEGTDAEEVIRIGNELLRGI